MDHNALKINYQINAFFNNYLYLEYLLSWSIIKEYQKLYGKRLFIRPKTSLKSVIVIKKEDDWKTDVIESNWNILLFGHRCDRPKINRNVNKILGIGSLNFFHFHIDDIL